MKAWPLVALSLVGGVGGCESPSDGELVPKPERQGALGSPPGAFLPSICWGEDDLRGWRRADPETVTAEEHDAARGSQCGWAVGMRDGIPIVSAAQRHRLPAELSHYQDLGHVSALERSQAGHLLGVDDGEWGGSLRWYSARGELKRILVEQGVVAILPAFGQFVALTYLGRAKPRAIEVLDRAGQFEVGRFVVLPGRPAAGIVDRDGTMLLATAQGLFRLSRSFQLNQEHEARWGMLQPRSVAVGNDETVYVGMRGVVIELKLSTTPPRETWLYPF